MRRWMSEHHPLILVRVKSCENRAQSSENSVARMRTEHLGRELISAQRISPSGPSTGPRRRLERARVRLEPKGPSAMRRPRLSRRRDIAESLALRR